MKLIIDIPDEMYQKIKETSSMFIVEGRRCGKRINYVLFTLFNAVKTGTPLSEELEKIKDEIKEKIEQEEFARSVFRNEEKDTVKAEQCTGSIVAYKNMIILFDKYNAECEEIKGENK